MVLGFLSRQHQIQLQAPHHLLPVTSMMVQILVFIASTTDLADEFIGNISAVDDGAGNFVTSTPVQTTILTSSSVPAFVTNVAMTLLVG